MKTKVYHNSCDTAEEQVLNVLNKKHFSSPVVFERTRLALLQTLSTAEKVMGDDENDIVDDFDYSKSASEDSDRLSSRTPLNVNQEQQDRQLYLQDQCNRFLIDEPEKKGKASSLCLDINLRGKWGYTELHFAALTGNVEECCRLLEKGADPSIMDNGGKMAWHKADLKGHISLANMLKPKEISQRRSGVKQ